MLSRAATLLFSFLNPFLMGISCYNSPALISLTLNTPFSYVSIPLNPYFTARIKLNLSIFLSAILTRADNLLTSCHFFFGRQSSFKFGSTLKREFIFRSQPHRERRQGENSTLPFPDSVPLRLNKQLYSHCQSLHVY